MTAYFEPSYQHSHFHHDQMHYTDPHQSYMVQSAPMIQMPNATKPNETKPRLGKDEVDILEREFKKNPKPSTQTKRQFADDMGVDLARINNWFQNRRAKRKQEKKQEAYEAGQAQDALGYSEPSSPDFYSNNGSGYYSDNQMISQQQTASFTMINGPPPSVAPYNPQYSDPATASMESLHRTYAAAHAAEQEDFHFSVHQDSLHAYGGPIIHGFSNSDRAQFPTADETLTQFESQSYSFPSNFSNDVYNHPVRSHSMVEVQSPEDISDHTPTQFNSYQSSSGPENDTPQLVTTFPSQLLTSHGCDGLSTQLGDNTCSQSPESHSGILDIGFKYDITESDESSNSPPPPPSSIPFKSPPPPMDIASRRKKVQVKPAALVADTLRGRPGIGPRTVSHAEGFRRPNESPISSPMRRIVSAGGNRNVLSGRIYKSGIESSQRSPINFGGFENAGAFMEHNYQSIRNPPSLNGSSINSSLAPPTPMSPRGEMTLVKRDSSRATASPIEFVFNAGTGCFTTMDGDQNLASPPETPQAQMVVNSSSTGWAPVLEFPEKQWQFEVPDEPLYTPAQDTFPLELHMPQPSYLSSMSQPVTPAFGQNFNANFMFGHESPQFKNESPQYTLSTQSGSEYSFPESNYPIGMSPTMTKQKTFQFSHTTAADFSEK